MERTTRDEESWIDHHWAIIIGYNEENIAMNEDDYCTIDEKRDVAKSGESEIDPCAMIVEENVVRSEKSEDATLDEENRVTCEFGLSPTKKKESGYFEDNRKEKLNTIIEKYANQYGSAVLSIGCSVSTESNELIIDEEAASLSDQEDSEQDFSASFCSTEALATINNHDNKSFVRDSAIFADIRVSVEIENNRKNSIVFTDDLEVMETIEVTTETVEDDLSWGCKYML